MDAKRAELSEARKARDPNLPGLATAADIESFASSLSQPVHSPSTPGILTMALPTTDPLTEPAIIATGTGRIALTTLIIGPGFLVSLYSDYCYSMAFYYRAELYCSSSHQMYQVLHLHTVHIRTLGQWTSAHHVLTLCRGCGPCSQATGCEGGCSVCNSHRTFQEGHSAHVFGRFCGSVW